MGFHGLLCGFLYVSHSVLLGVLVWYPSEEIGSILCTVMEVVVFSHIPLLSLESSGTSLYMEPLS